MLLTASQEDEEDSADDDDGRKQRRRIQIPAPTDGAEHTDNHTCYISREFHTCSEHRGVSDRPSEVVRGPVTSYSVCVQETELQ